jgi:uncharacterized protein (DUF488 family)
MGAARFISFTIGYAGRTVVDFVRLLQEAGVQRVVDVRELPLSRRRGFSKTLLSRSLASGGIEYVHVRSAGNPFRHMTGDIDTCLASYGSYLDSRPDVVAEVERAINGSRAALLCAEADASQCHRSVIASRLRQSNPDLVVQHL